MLEALWAEWFWLPPGYTWGGLRRGADGVFRAQLSDLWVSLACAVAVYAARRLLVATVLRPLGLRLRLSDAAFEPQGREDQLLEAAFQESADQDLAALAKKVGWPERRVSNWLRRRRNLQRANLLTKFCESGWQLSFYTVSCAYGAAALWHKNYLWHTVHIWRGWPDHHVTDDVYWYYMVELGFYWTALASVFSDTKKKDFREMLIHHLVTIALMVFSWGLNLTRVGALVLVLHDAADPMLNLAKVGGYTRRRCLSDPAFLLFLCVWFATRLGLYPFHIVRSCLFEVEAECGICPAFRILQALLLLLLVLHVIWTYFALKVALRVVWLGERKDTRSDSEESVDETASDSNEADRMRR